MAFLNGSHNFEIGSATFQNINQIYHPPIDALGILDRERAVEATHKSSTAEYSPKCNPKTRKQVIADIVDWVNAAPATPKSILWLDGPVGAGKTCIMREVIDRCDNTPGIIVASYFFSAWVDELNNERPFVATIAHQLSLMATPGLKPAILHAISENPTMFRDGLEAQMEALVIKPLRASGFGTPSSPGRVVMVIDGFDECQEPQRKHLLRILLSLVDKLSPSITIILASRPKLDIRTTFDLPEFEVVTNIIQLHKYNGTNDVRIFYCDEFEKIRTSHPLRHYIPKGWPTERLLQVLIRKSSGSFIYPATIMKYIADHPRRNPTELLENAMAASSSSASDNPLAELDALYTFILHPPDTDIPLMKRVLHSIIALHGLRGLRNVYMPHFLDQFFQLPSGSIEATICDLHSLLRVDSPDAERGAKKISFHHKSLEDYLFTPRRSSDLYQPISDTYADLTLACIRHLEPLAMDPRYNVNLPRPLMLAVGLWFFFLGRCLESTTKPLIPNTILEFDPRIVWRFCLLKSGRISRGMVQVAQLNCHSSLCQNESECLPLCKRLVLIDQCTARAEEARSNHRRVRNRHNDKHIAEETVWRLNALSHLENDLYPELRAEGPLNQDAQGTQTPDNTSLISLEGAKKVKQETSGVAQLCVMGHGELVDRTEATLEIDPVDSRVPFGNRDGGGKPFCSGDNLVVEDLMGQTPDDPKGAEQVVQTFKRLRPFTCGLSLALALMIVGLAWLVQSHSKDGNEFSVNQSI